MKLTLLSFCLFFLLIPFKLFAQKGEVRGGIYDSLNIPVTYASVAVFDLRDSSVITFGLSDDGGGFQLDRLPINTPLRLLVSHVLYHTVLKNFKLDSAGHIQEFDSLKLTYKSNEFAESIVTWEAPPITIRNDTVEFSADAFIGRPGSAVEDLLKRIPGIQIDEDGTVTYNGKKVNKITIDSKDFFSNDPVILMKNIPAKAIEKVQVSRAKDDRGIELETGEVSVNLTLKHWAKKSHFGKAYAGYGTDGRYEAGGLWNLMRDTFQISFIGFSNNLSQAGFSFSDLYKLGGFERSGFSGFTQYSDGRIEANGLNMGGGNGITESGALGFNLNYDIPKKIKLNSSYFLGLNRTNYVQNELTKRFLGDSTLTFERDAKNLLKNASHTFNADLKWIIDTVQIVRIVPGFRINSSANSKNRFDENRYLNQADYTQITNKNTSEYDEMEWHNTVSYDWKKRKNSFYIRSSQNQTNAAANGGNDYIIRSFDDSVFSEQIEQQARITKTNTFRLGNTAYYRRIQNDSTIFSVGLNYNYTNGYQEVTVNDIDSMTGLPNFLQNLSTDFFYTTQDASLSFGSFIRRGKGKFSGNISALLADYALQNKLKGNELNNQFQMLESNLTYTIKHKKNEVSFEYRLNQELPYYWQLLELTDNNDPNQIRRGNPNLKPSLSHSLNISNNYTNTEKNYWSSQSIYMNAENHAVITARSFDESGRSISQPINLAPEYWRMTYGFQLSGGMRVKLNEKWSFRPYMRINGSHRRSYTSLNDAIYENVAKNVYGHVSLNLNVKEKVDFTFIYRPDLNNNITSALGASSTRLNQVCSFAWWYAPFKKVWIEGKYTYWNQSFLNSSYSANNYSLWNMALTYLVLKENRGQIRLSVFDVLGQNQFIERENNEYEQTVKTINAVTRYAMLSFVYNFNSFQNTGRQQRGFSFW